eukprot:NODE_1657_length_1859_cov_177.801843_g1404_i0.p1 GENE.NODE_1657_length_1859_cov_177.801843_g1404_i0~~NODE_1657_length_1859_cov_177.801843_g1404_i0.p1  ORF type:complete len:532 (+),score=116.30 NODE_1657_length_1859_cov_177.801843_g1404_i0:68-1663(+)
MDCAGCKLTQVLKDSDLLKTVQLNNAGPKVTVSSSHTCESVKKPAPKPAETKAPSPKLEPKPKPKPQAIPPKTEEAPKKKGSSTKKEAEVETKKEGSKTTKAPKAAPKAKAPVDPTKKSFKLSFVFPKSNKAQGFFSKTKPAIYYAVGQNITVEMVQAEGDEITVWESYFETPSPKSGLLAVRINPLIYDGKADSKARLTKIIELFSEERSYCIVDTDSADIFQPAYGEEEKKESKGNRGDRSNKQSEPPTCHNCSEVGHIARNCPQKENAEKSERKPKRDPKERKENKERKRDDNRPAKEFDPSTTECYNCKKTGHIARDCQEPKPKREPREPRKQRTEEEQQQYLAEVKCRRCNGVGHLAKDCTAARNLDDVLCYKCQEKGHFAKDCQNESRPRADKPERAERSERTERTERRGQDRSGRQNEGGRGRGGRYVEKKDKPADNGPVVCERIFKSKDGSINEKRGCGGDHFYGKCPNAPVVCERFFTNREGFVTEKLGCNGEHAYNDCPKAVCNQCGNNHHSNVCPYIYRR